MVNERNIMHHCHGGQVEFERPVDAKGNIEVWLQRLVDGMQDTVKQGIKRAVRNVAEQQLDDFIFGNPAQARERADWVGVEPM
jgi:hypothetical protein